MTPRRRTAWILAALAPGAALQVAMLDPSRAGWLLLAPALVIAGEALARRAGRAGDGLGGALLTGLLLALLLPPGLALAWVVAAALAAAAVRAFAGDAGGSFVHPAMFGVAVALLAGAPPLEPLRHGFRAELPAAIAYAAGGLLLLARGIVRWQAPAALLAVFALLALPGWLAGAGLLEIVVLPLFAATTWLLAFFVAGDGAPGALSAPARLVTGAGIAALAALFWQAGRVDAGFAPAVLLMNLLAPALDRWLAPAPPQVDA